MLEEDNDIDVDRLNYYRVAVVDFEGPEEYELTLILLKKILESKNLKDYRNKYDNIGLKYFKKEDKDKQKKIVEELVSKGFDVSMGSFGTNYYQINLRLDKGKNVDKLKKLL